LINFVLLIHFSDDEAACNFCFILLDASSDFICIFIVVIIVTAALLPCGVAAFQLSACSSVLR
jgi:hypothetical protein